MGSDLYLNCYPSANQFALCSKLKHAKSIESRRPGEREAKEFFLYELRTINDP